jgi:hypothetical protein
MTAAHPEYASSPAIHAEDLVNGWFSSRRASARLDAANAVESWVLPTHWIKHHNMVWLLSQMIWTLNEWKPFLQ